MKWETQNVCPANSEGFSVPVCSQKDSLGKSYPTSSLWKSQQRMQQKEENKHPKYKEKVVFC